MLSVPKAAKEEPEVPSTSFQKTEILEAVARRRGNKQMARDLSISEDRKKLHIEHLREAARLRPVGAVLYAIREDL